MFDFTDIYDFGKNAIKVQNPVAGFVIEGIEHIVKSSNEKVSDQSAFDVIKKMAESVGNRLDYKRLRIFKKLLESDYDDEFLDYVYSQIEVEQASNSKSVEFLKDSYEKDK